MPPSAKAKRAGCWERKSPGSSVAPGLSQARKFASCDRSRSNQRISKNDRSRYKRHLRPDAQGPGKARCELAGRAAFVIRLDHRHHGHGISLWLADHAEEPPTGCIAQV